MDMTPRSLRVLALALALDSLACGPVVVAAQTAEVAPSKASPRFRDDGPNADVFGRSEGYPICRGLAYVNEARCRVGALSHYDALFPARTIAAVKKPIPLARASAEPPIHYTFAGLDLTLDDYLNRHPVTGLLIAKGDTILVERYQYGRRDSDRFTSFSVAKTIIGLLMGIAVKEGAVRSINDHAESYVPGLRGTEYGRTSIKALLQMTSGVIFSEDYANTSSDIYALARLTLEQDPGGSLEAVKRFDKRRAEPGALFSYSSADTVVLGLILAAATGRTISDYASEKLWRPLGAEADATWNIDATGQEITFAYVNAVLRDWARLGLMLANRGTWLGKPIVAADWLTANPVETNTALLRYGYQVWLSADTKRFLLRGLRGQFIFVDPETKLVLVQTALNSSDFELSEFVSLWMAIRAQLR
jgi:CubicO group peptidase (beta-lactamase class C family)